MTRRTKSEGAKTRNAVRAKLQRIRDEHDRNHKGSITECSKCIRAWKAIEADLERVRRRHKGSPLIVKIRGSSTPAE